MTENKIVNISDDIQRAGNRRHLWGPEKVQPVLDTILEAIPGSYVNWDGPYVEAWAMVLQRQDSGVGYVCAQIPLMAVRSDLEVSIENILPKEIVIISYHVGGGDEYVCDFDILASAFSDSLVLKKDYVDGDQLKPFSITDLYVDTVV